MEDHFASMPQRGGAPGGGAVLSCLADTLGYRYRWATEGLPEPALAFRPDPTGRNLHELLQHLRDLAWWLHLTVTGEHAERDATSLDDLRRTTLTWLATSSERLAHMGPEALTELRIQSGRGTEPQPVWNMIHGPLADFLTHVGQVNSWRRMAGSPPPGARVFLRALRAIDPVR